MSVAPIEFPPPVDPAAEFLGPPTDPEDERRAPVEADEAARFANCTASFVVEVRGLGSMLAIELTDSRRHLAECQSLASLIGDYGGFESHTAFVARLRQPALREPQLLPRLSTRPDLQPHRS